MKLMTPEAAWGGREGNGSSQREREDGKAALVTLPTPLCKQDALESHPPTCSYCSSLPGKSRQVTLVTRRQGRREVKASCNIHGTMTEHSLAL